MKREVMALTIVFGLFVSLSSMVSAGIGIVSYQETILLNEGEEGCLPVGAYNPFGTDTYALVGVSEELLPVLTEQSAETKLLPADTSSAEAIPLEFCFKVPKVYERDCAVGSFVCALSCPADLKTYEGKVSLRTVPGDTVIGGTGGSSTRIEVSHNLRVRVACQDHPRDYTLVYVVIALLAAIGIIWVLVNKYRKPKAVRDREKLAKLKAEIAKESKGKKKSTKGKGKKSKK